MDRLILVESLTGIVIDTTDPDLTPLQAANQLVGLDRVCSEVSRIPPHMPGYFVYSASFETIPPITDGKGMHAFLAVMHFGEFITFVAAIPASKHTPNAYQRYRA